MGMSGKMKKSLVIGASGLVGSALMRQLGPSAVGTVNTADTENGKYRQLNITNMQELDNIMSKEDPEIVYIPAGITSVDKCEEQRALTSITNIGGIKNVLGFCLYRKVVFFSTSYLFDGKKDSPYDIYNVAHPLNIYGQQKLEMESYIQMHLENWVIVRTVGVFGKEKRNKNFPAQIIRALTLGNEIHVPMDQIMNPVLSDDLAKRTISLGELHQGMFHVSGDVCLSKYQFAKDIAFRADLDEKLIVATDSKNMRQSADRPKNGCLDCSSLVNVGMSVPSYYKGLSEYFRQ